MNQGVAAARESLARAMDIKTAVHNPNEDLHHIHAVEINAVNEMLVDDLSQEFVKGSPSKERLHALFDRKEKMHKHNLKELREEEQLWREEFDHAVKILDWAEMTLEIVVNCQCEIIDEKASCRSAPEVIFLQMLWKKTSIVF